MKEQIVKKYYEYSAEDYNTVHYEVKQKYPTLIYRHNYILKMIDKLNLPPDSKILDIGCGPGAMVADLMKEERKIWGIDIAEKMIEIAENKVMQQNKKNEVHLVVGDIENLDFGNEFFDLIICSGVIEYLKDDTKWPVQLYRILKPNGFLIINITNKYAVRKWTSPLLEFFKSNKQLYMILNFIKQKVFKMGKLNYFPFKLRMHSPKKFDKQLASYGFKKISHNYFDFSLLPAPFDTILGFVTIPVKKQFEKKHSKKNMVLSGTGYLVCTKKINTKIL